MGNCTPMLVMGKKKCTPMNKKNPHRKKDYNLGHEMLEKGRICTCIRKYKKVN